ncbi:MAG: hypothetical protein JRI36_12485 [Deltaproteobacteria bacterium]|nr:hypothetical protein [Deltaproteobacteria bacterium]
MKRRRKAPSIDAMMRFFLQYYNIPTKQDIDKIIKRIDRLEALIRKDAAARYGKSRAAGRKAFPSMKHHPKMPGKTTATQQLITIIKSVPEGVDIPTLKKKSGFEDKKVRNIVFRLCRRGIIKRVRRGVYALPSS